MPKRTDIQKILILGAGPIVIGQACEFDYSGTQACKALKEEGYEIILMNSNPATIMTDPEFADKTYIEPLTPFFVEKVIEKEKPHALLPTLGGQTALNLAKTLAENGILQKHGVELIGAKLSSIQKAEDRELFKEAMIEIGLEVPKSSVVSSLSEALSVIQWVGYPAIIRPSYTLGGQGGNIAYNLEEFREAIDWGLNSSPIHEVLIEQSVLGWKEFELEVMRDLKDNVVIICSIENFDPMGIHTGDSITVAPIQTLTDKEYQLMRESAKKIIRKMGVDTGGSNIQFSVHPKTGKQLVIEMNPRVSRSSALASKATGFPIAKIAAKLAVGYTLDEIQNDITKETPASFEPTLDYVVTKIPRFAFEKFPQSDTALTTQMKSVGEVMSIGRTFKESLQKAICSLETNHFGFTSPKDASFSTIVNQLKKPNAERLLYIGESLRRGFTIDQIYELTQIDPWFLRHIQEIIESEKEVKDIKQAKSLGFSDYRLGVLTQTSEEQIRKLRKEQNITPQFKTVDTCAAEFEAHTPYFYSTYDGEDETMRSFASLRMTSPKKKMMILGGGPNRIGQGIEFDYCCVHASLALREDGFETIMVNCNPETVSTDYDISDKLYFEPLTIENILAICEKEKPQGVIVQFGGQTPLKLCKALEYAGVPIIGTQPSSIHLAEDREEFSKLIQKLNLKQPPYCIARNLEQAREVSRKLGYPVLVRPSYVLGGRAMEIVYDDDALEKFVLKALEISDQNQPILLDKFLKNAQEIDVDAICDGKDVFIGGIMEHIEEAGIHSGDSTCSIPSYTLSPAQLDELREHTQKIAFALNVRGLMNVQYAIQNGDIYVLEVNPRASRTVPFASKATGAPLAKIAARVMAGKTLKELGYTKEIIPKKVSVKEVVFPFIRFPGCDVLLGPEMRSTGEVMGSHETFALAFAKAYIATGSELPLKGTAFISVKDEDKERVFPLAKKLSDLGFKLMATGGTHQFLRDKGVLSTRVKKVLEGRPNVVDNLKNNEIDLVINTTSGAKEISDSYSIRRTALLKNIPYFTVLSAAKVAMDAIEHLQQYPLTVESLQERLSS
ncbi:MAG: carbamoyl phosphate synthase large subunit [Deltaproteobacteria bacterium GWA2_38_16]|nr:MAG: carbamoyl phosphate synthase large subunit [Deltaproteobacteria bacterium GWA2_38_16]OGQ02713.1 MAG: carbamoyl phosphate synthase large subunit [Deltaproteobacteria bacterium RIFCSPHIGHO2_02_FULL_38_15]HBQ20573.1 carbamoyl phosphate synthase large subunit [Deltaproteobacteria bacterium]